MYISMFMRRWLSVILLSNLLILAVKVSPVSAEGAPAGIVTNTQLSFACTAVGGNPLVTVDIVDAPLQEFVRFVSCVTQKNVVFRPEILATKTVTIIGPKSIPTAELFSLLRTVLMDHGLELKKQGGFFRIAGLDPPANTQPSKNP